MLQVAASIWNRVAKERPQTEFGKRLFPLDQKRLTEAMQLEAEKFQTQGYESKVIRAFQTVAPLVAEREAINRYVEKQPGMRQALPEVNSLEEALILASNEYLLSTSQQAELKKLLLQLEA